MLGVIWYQMGSGKEVRVVLFGPNFQVCVQVELSLRRGTLSLTNIIRTQFDTCYGP